jgi:alkylhydroperoxidase family enzyme
MDTRIAPAPLRELGPLARLVAKGVGRFTGGEPPNVFTTLGRHRRLFRAWLPFAGTLLLRTHLPRADVELLVLRTSCNCSAPYEWAQHVALARRAGLADSVIAAVPAWGEHVAAFSARQGLLLTATDELHAHKVLTDGTWSELASRLDERERIELCMIVGHYEMLAMTLNSLGVEPEPSSRALLDESTGQTADNLGAALDAICE